MTAKRFLFLLFFVLTHQFGLSQAPTSKSYYVPAVNGTKLAVDVYFPKAYNNQKLPVLFEFTRYWRGKEDAKTGNPMASLSERDNYFLNHDYILAKVDVRGTGASYGLRTGEYTPTEVKDGWYIVDWVVNQPWSDGTVGAYGTSYSGTTAELLTATQHPAVKAVIPGWSDFDVYQSPSRPYGMLATSFIAPWSQYVNWLDQNSVTYLGASVRRIGEDFPMDAIKEHETNPIVLDAVTKAPYRDSKFGDFKFEELDPLHWKKEISESNVPMLVLTSWLDAGTAEGTLLRLQHFTNPQKIVMMPTSHGGRSHASPFVVSNGTVAPVPSVAEQLRLQLDFFDHYLKGKDKGVEDWPAISYYNFGEESFKQSNVWPPEGQQRIKYFLDAKGKLTSSLSDVLQGRDEYLVDFSVSTGTNNRWTTQMGKDVLNLDNRNAADSLMLTYTTEPLTEPLQITGTPVISLQLTSTHKEGAIFVYLEDVDPNGRSRYITEGGLLLEHRKLSQNDMFDGIPYHSFNQSDASPMPIGKIEEVSFKLHPTSICIKPGHAIRIAISGADKDTFDKVPTKGTPTLGIYRNKTNTSFLELPIVK
ncbi:MAG: CocE/NonD family hydrolase [Bacteroidota bacterium]